MSKIISLNNYLLNVCDSVLTAKYQVELLNINKHDLLSEMVLFQERRNKAGALDRNMILRGIVLFKLLSTTAETLALETLSNSYKKYLQTELTVLDRAI